jgi:cellulose synthase/poly-beta-1,6-N-acetylglucosamine synthase-like glycosyltransferase
MEPTARPTSEVLPDDIRRGGVRRDIERLKVDRVGLGQLVVMLVVGMILAVAAISVAVVRLFALGANPSPVLLLHVGPLTTYVSDQLPVTALVIVALAGMVAVAAAAVSLEVGTTLLLSLNPRRRQLAAYRRVRDEQQAPVGPVRVTVVIPAHNEEDTLPATLEGLANQTRRPDRTIVVADNSTDRTVEIAREHGVEVFETVSNWQKKAGALNQTLSVILGDKGPSDAILLMDADTVLSDRFIEAAAGGLDEDPELAAVGARFRGAEGHGMIGQFQRNEFLRYSPQISARRGRVFVLTGTATMFRADVLLDIAAARGVYIPGESGQVYDTAALTEDNEITLALKSLGGQMISPDDCWDVTEIMPTWRALWVQRQRWQRGALENLNQYGVAASTVRYWGQQFGIGYGVVALNSSIAFMFITAVSVDAWVWFPFWMAVTATFVVERTMTVWHGGWRARLLSVVLIPEISYAVFLQAVFVKCLYDITLQRTATWGHSGEVSKP